MWEFFACCLRKAWAFRYCIVCISSFLLGQDLNVRRVTSFVSLQKHSVPGATAFDNQGINTFYVFSFHNAVGQSLAPLLNAFESDMMLPSRVDETLRTVPSRTHALDKETGASEQAVLSLFSLCK